jgi:hypothetical protein
MQRIKITEPGWAGFNGPLGLVEFKDGVSVDPVPQRLADQITALVLCETVIEEGAEAVSGQAGPASRMVGAQLVTAAVEEALQRQTDRERAAEDTLIAIKTSKEAKIQIYTKDQLEKLVDIEGLSGLRKIGDLWSVRDRAIPALIGKILTAQNEFEASMKEKQAQAAASADEGRQVIETDQGDVAVVPDARPVRDTGEPLGADGIAGLEDDEALSDEVSEDASFNKSESA